MKKLLFILMVIFWSGISTLKAQIVTDKTYFDFGEVEKDDIHYVDFKLTNVTQEKIRILRFEKDYGVSARASDELIDPDESVLVRVKYTPKRKGEFKGNLRVFVSSNNEPLILTIEGKAMSVNMDETLDVPEFKEVHEEKADETFPLDIVVLKKEDKSAVEGAQVEIVWNGLMYKNLNTSGEGIVSNDWVADKYYIVVNAEGLGSFESELSIHQSVREFVIELGPEGTIAQVTIDSADVYETEIVEVEKEDDDVVVITPPDKVEDKTQENPEFADNEYKPNNIVFLIDVSVSMKQKGKMNLLKASMIELTDLLRSVDKVAIVTYSSKADLVLESTSAADKDDIKLIIQSLEPQGSTSSAKGVKKAYQVLADNEIKDGNNMIFISTDGAFNLDKQDKGLLGMARKNAKKGYVLSVVGIKNEKWTVKNMKLLAEEGNGHYLHISNYNDATTKVVEEVKFHSKNE